MVVESIFAHIFASQSFMEFALKMSFVEINSEQTYDLFRGGTQFLDAKEIHWIDVDSIENAI